MADADTLFLERALRRIFRSMLAAGGGGTLGEILIVRARNLGPTRPELLPLGLPPGMATIPEFKPDT